MGLGKTCEAVVSLAILSSSFPNGSLALIICPLSVIDHWENELKRYAQLFYAN
jgi:SNF2 family DNA or RNA helicase